MMKKEITYARQYMVTAESTSTRYLCDFVGMARLLSMVRLPFNTKIVIYEVNLFTNKFTKIPNTELKSLLKKAYSNRILYLKQYERALKRVK
jgi:hypothetical protein